MKRTARNPDGVPLERAIQPWLVIDLALSFRNDHAIDRRPLDRLALVTTIVLVWLAGPYVLGVLWQNTFTLHNFWLTSFSGACLFLATIVGVESWAKLESDTKPQRAAVDTTQVQRYRRAPYLFALVLFCGLLGTKGLYVPGDQRNLPDMLTGRPLAARPNLFQAQLSALPPDQRDPIIARAKYRALWCDRVGLAPNICGTLPSERIPAPPYQSADRRAWCDTKSDLDGEACDAYFSGRDAEFEREWQGYRKELIVSFVKPDMRNRDMRNANLALSTLTGIDFSGAKLDGANLSDAQMEGADLRGAQMDGADLSDAQMEGANLSGAQMEGADLSFAQMEGADLSFAQMEGANLSFAQMKRADLRGANLKSAVWAGVTIDSVPAQTADFRGAQDLDQSRLSSLIGNAATLLPDDPNSFVCTCWASEPTNWSILVANLGRIGWNEDVLRAAFLCPPGQRPQKTGTPWPVDQPPPWGDFPLWSDEAETWAAAQALKGDHHPDFDGEFCP